MKELNFEKMENTKGGGKWDSYVCSGALAGWGALVAFGIGGPAGLAFGLAYSLGTGAFCTHFS